MNIVICTPETESMCQVADPGACCFSQKVIGYPEDPDTDVVRYYAEKGVPMEMGD